MWLFFSYIAVCFPIVHRDLVHTYSVAKRVMAYTIPVLIISLLINIPKFLETKAVARDDDVDDSSASHQSDAAPSNESSQQPARGNNVYFAVAVTELRLDPT